MSVKASHWVWNQHSIKGNTKLVLLAMAEHADMSGVCWPGLDRVEEMTEANEKTVISCVQTLIDINLVKEIKRRTRKGRRRSSIYILNMDNEPDFGGVIDNGFMDVETQDALVGSIIDKDYQPVKITGSEDLENPVDNSLHQPVKISEKREKISEKREKISETYKEVEPLQEPPKKNIKPSADFASQENPLSFFEKMGGEFVLMSVDEWQRYFKLHEFNDGQVDTPKAIRMFERWISDKVTLAEIQAVTDAAVKYRKGIVTPCYYDQPVTKLVAMRNGKPAPKYAVGRYPFPESDQDFIDFAKVIGEPAKQGELMPAFRSRTLKAWHRVKKQGRS